MEREDAELWLSPISIWEMLTLVDRSRVRLASPAHEWVTTALQRVPLHEAPVTHEVALETRNVPLSHRDPADRLLIATARVFDLNLVTADERLIGLKAVPTLANR
jgi:PIN domain nuclease of toxin-antitoxin system